MHGARHYTAPLLRVHDSFGPYSLADIVRRTIGGWAVGGDAVYGGGGELPSPRTGAGRGGDLPLPQMAFPLAFFAMILCIDVIYCVYPAMGTAVSPYPGQERGYGVTLPRSPRREWPTGGGVHRAPCMTPSLNFSVNLRPI